MKISQLLTQNNAEFQDVLFIQSLGISKTKSGKDYGSGTVITSDKKTLDYKIWDKPLLEELKNAQTQSKETKEPLILNATGEINIYNGSTGIVIRSLFNLEEGQNFTPMNFLTSDYDVKQLLDRLYGVYKSKITPDGLEVVGKILIDPLATQFINSTSAIKHHDSQLHGLLAHTTKMMEIAGLVVQNYPHIFNNDKAKDLFIIGLLLHDIGKTQEYSYLAPSNRAFLGHRYLGALILEQHREFIESKYGLEGCDHLISILLQHHGQYEERPRTVLAYAVHLVDVFEAKMTGLNESLGEALEMGSHEIFVRDTATESFRLQIISDNFKDVLK